MRLTRDSGAEPAAAAAEEEAGGGARNSRRRRRLERRVPARNISWGVNGSNHLSHILVKEFQLLDSPLL